MNKKKKASRLKHRKNQERVKNLLRASRLKARPKKIVKPKDEAVDILSTEESTKKTTTKKTAAKKTAAKKTAAKKTTAKKTTTKKTAVKKTTTKKTAAKKTD